ncbi:hypothetical protein [Helicobacter sp. T3_23-1059]
MCLFSCHCERARSVSVAIYLFVILKMLVILRAFKPEVSLNFA